MIVNDELLRELWEFQTSHSEIRQILLTHIYNRQVFNVNEISRMMDFFYNLKFEYSSVICPPKIRPTDLFRKRKLLHDEIEESKKRLEESYSPWHMFTSFNLYEWQCYLYVKFENEYERIERENYEKYEIEWERSRNEQDEFNPVIKINEVKLQALQDFQTANEILISQINHHFINIFPKEEKRVYDDDDDNSLINPIDHPLYNDDLDMDQQNPNIW